MEKKNSLRVSVIGSIFFLAVMIAGCTAQLNSPNIIEVPSTATRLAIPTSNNVVDNTPISVVATPTLPAGARTTLPDGIANMMDPSLCPRACYLGFMPGQTKAEVLAILTSLGVNNPEINDEKDEVEGTTSIRWLWGIVAFRDDQSIYFGINSTNAVPVALILKQFGEPDYIDVAGVGDDWFYSLIYIHQDTVVNFYVYDMQSGGPKFLSGNTLLQKIGVEDIESYFTWICGDGWEKKFQEWKGYGGLGVYFDENGQLLDQVSIVDCDDYNQ